MTDPGYPADKGPTQWNQPPAYDPSSAYPPPSGVGPVTYDGSVGVVNTQPQHAATNVIIAEPQERPNHGLAVASLIFALVTLVLSCGGSLLCAIPSIILSALALASDYRVEQAKTMSIVSLIFTGAFWICVAITIVIVVIVTVVAANSVVASVDTSYNQNTFLNYY